MSSIAASNSLFEIDLELEALVEQIQEHVESAGEASQELMTRFQQFCNAHGEKVDRIGRFVRMMEAREQFCRSEAARLGERARATANKVDRTKSMVLFYLMSRDLRKIEGREFTLRVQKNSQDSIKILDASLLPMAYRKVDVRMEGTLWEAIRSHLPGGLAKALEASVQETRPDVEVIKEAIIRHELVPGAEMHRGSHLRIA